MLNQITLILCCHLAGELTSKFFNLPAPGPVIGMVYLLCLLLWRGKLNKDLETTANQLLDNLSLLFVPAGVGVMLHFDRLSTDWLPITMALIGSTIATIIVTGILMQWLSNPPAEKSHLTPKKSMESPDANL
jgi:putative effector of murein hydrolase LrgA (UPF0299 family)